MLITSLELRNVKSYGERGIQIPFQSGVNLICGQNGSGKSTILESIGYALFNALDYKQAQFCREGEKSGQIVLTFLSGLDERQYQVIRGVGRSKFEIYDLATKSYLARSRGNSQDWLMEHLGVEMDYASVLFSNAVGVSQGRMIGSFLESKRGRESHFNSMLRVDEYEKAWQKLRETKRYLNEQLTEADKVVAYLTGRLTRLPEVCEQEKRLAAQIQADRDALSETRARLSTLEHELSAWDAAFATVERLIQQLNEANQALASLDRERQGALETLQAAEKAAAIVAESAAGYTAYEEALRQRDELEARRKVRDRQEAALRATERDLTEITTTLAHLNRELEAVAKAEARLAALVPLVERQMALEKEADELQKSVAEHKLATQRAEGADQRIANLTNTLANIQTQLKERRDIEERLSALAKERSELTRLLDAFPAQLTPLRQQRTQLEADVRRATEEKQDYQNAKERLSDEQATLARLQAELTQIEAQLAQRRALLERLDTIEKTMSLDLERKQAAQHAAEMAQQRIDLIAPLTQLYAQFLMRTDLEERLAALTKQRRDLTRQLDAFPAQLTPLREQRTQLEADVRRATEEKQDYQNAKERLSDEQATLARLQAELIQIEAQLEQRRALLERLDTIEQTMSLELERKQAAQRAAETAQQRADLIAPLTQIYAQLQTRTDLEERLTALTKQRSDLTKQLDAFPAQLTPLREQRTQLEADVRRATEEKQDYQNAKERLSDEQATLARLQAELTQIEAQLEERRALLERLDTIEQTMSLELERKQAAQRAAETAQQRVDLIAPLTQIYAQLQKRTDLEERLAALSKQRTHLTKQLDAFPAQLTSLRKQRTQLEADVRHATEEKQKFQNAKERLGFDSAILMRLQAELAEIEKQLEQRTAIRKRLETIKEAITKEQIKKSAAESTHAHSKKRLKALKKRLEMLQSSESADCPVCKRPLDAHQANEIEEEVTHEEAKVQAELASAQTEAQAAASALQALKEEQKSLQSVEGTLPAPRRASELRQQINTQQRQVTQWQARVNGLAGADAQLEQSKKSLEGVEKSLTSLNNEQATLQSERDKLDDRYSTLNQQLLRVPQPARSDCPICQRPLDAHLPDEIEEEVTHEQAKVQAQLATAQSEAQAADNALKALKEEQKSQQNHAGTLPAPGRDSTLRQQINTQQTQVTQWQARVNGLAGADAQLEQSKESLEGVEKSLTSLNNEQTTLQTERDKLDDRYSTLNQQLLRVPQPARTDCAICQRPLKAHRASEIEEEVTHEQAKVQAELASAQSEAQAADSAGKASQEEQKSLQSVAGTLPAPRRALELRQQINTQQTQVTEWQARRNALAGADAQLERRKKALSHVESTLTSLNNEQTTLQTERDKLDDRYSTLNQQLLRVPQPARTDCAICQRPLKAHRASEIEEEVTHEEAKVQAQLATAQTEAQAADSALRARKEEQKSQQSLAGTLPAPGRASELRQQILTQQTHVTEWQTRLNTLAGADAQLERHKKALSHVESTLIGLNNEQTTLRNRREELDKARTTLTQRLTQLPQPTRADEITSELEQANAQRADLEHQIKQLSTAPAQLERVQIAHAALNDPRSEQTAQQSIANKRPTLEKQHKEKETRQSQLLKQQQSEQNAVSAFATLEADIETNKRILTTKKNAHKQYLANQTLAQTRDSHQQTVTRLRDLHSAQRRILDDYAEQHKQATTHYDSNQQVTVKKEIQSRNNQLIALQTQLKTAQTQYEQLKKELTKLKILQEDHQAAQKEVTRWKRLNNSFRFIRDGIRQAGPSIVQRRVRLISHQADQIFQDILENPTYHLNWNESYAITLSRRGEKRSFQQLSGGEQMAAAIAVRLALLTQMSKIRLLFLDEPTSNLDEQRRDKLADRITQLEGLKQIFVITHDDSFQRDSHHVLRVSKKNGSSIVSTTNHLLGLWTTQKAPTSPVLR